MPRRGRGALPGVVPLAEATSLAHGYLSSLEWPKTDPEVPDHMERLLSNVLAQTLQPLREAIAGLQQEQRQRRPADRSRQPSLESLATGDHVSVPDTATSMTEPEVVSQPMADLRGKVENLMTLTGLFEIQIRVLEDRYSQLREMAAVELGHHHERLERFAGWFAPDLKNRPAADNTTVTGHGTTQGSTKVTIDGPIHHIRAKPASSSGSRVRSSSPLHVPVLVLPSRETILVPLVDVRDGLGTGTVQRRTTPDAHPAYSITRHADARGRAPLV